MSLFGLKYLHKDRHGNWRVRKRLDGRDVYVPIKDDDGKWIEPVGAVGIGAFMAVYQDIVSGRRTTKRRTMKDLVADYRASDRWARLSSRTRSDYNKVLCYLADEIGGRELGRLTRKSVIDLMNTNAHRIRFANYIQLVLSVMFEHAIDRDWLRDNPAKGVNKLRMPEEKRQVHVPWTDEAVAKFRAEAGALPRLIFELGVGTVQRPGDLVKFRWGDFDGEGISLRQGKTGKVLWVPCPPPLRAALTATPRRGIFILTLNDGQPMSYRRMAEIMRAERERLGLRAFDLHALRYRGVMELAWAGCTDDEIASYSGHDTTAMIRKYAGEAQQRTRAREAAQRREKNATRTG